MLKSYDNITVTSKSVKSSILKSSNNSNKTASERLNESLSKTKPKVHFVLPASKKIETILQNFLDGSNVREYERLLSIIINADIDDDDLQRILQESTQLVLILNQDLRLFVEALLSIKWLNRDKIICDEYQSFLLNLLSAHNYYTRYAINVLVSNFKPNDEETEWPNGVPTDEDCIKCENLHKALSMLLHIVPMCKEMLMQALINQFPYFKKSTHTHEYYLHNLLWILDYHRQFRPEIFHLIFSKLVILDVNAPKEQIEKAEEEDENIFEMEEESACKVKDPVAHTLDVLMDKMINYVIMECHDMESGDINWENTKTLYQDMIKVFDQVILPTYNTHHVQYIMFVICCFKTAVTEGFLNYLWKKVCTPNVPVIIRQSAVFYIASLIARATFVPLQMLKGTLQQMSNWIHAYIANQDGLECVNSDVRVHCVFYSVCQSLFYVIAFRQKDLFNNRKNINFLETLHLGKIVTSRLNPLRVCQDAVVQNFAAITRKYQIAYCYSIMEHNSRNILPIVYQDDKGSLIQYKNSLDTFFPFDPYMLKRSNKKILPFYLSYQNCIEDCEIIDNNKRCYDMDDDFMGEETRLNTSKKARFSYGTSPGFMQ